MTEKNEIQILIDRLARLPGLGPKSSSRIVLLLIKKRQQQLLPLLDALERFASEVRECPACGNATVKPICNICESNDRQSDVICVVANVADLWAMERSGAFVGRYYVLGGLLSILDGLGPEELRIPNLVERIEKEKVKELILALSATVDGQTTAHYIAEQLQGVNVAITSLGQGIPIGGELDYLDAGTISAALAGRREY